MILQRTRKIAFDCSVRSSHTAHRGVIVVQSSEVLDTEERKRAITANSQVKDEALSIDTIIQHARSLVRVLSA